MMASSLNHAVLMCHAPIVIPEVGGDRGSECLASTRGMTLAGAHLASRDLDAVIVVSPHTPRSPSAFTRVGGERLRGDMSRFGAPQVAFDLPGDDRAAAAIAEACLEEGLPAPEPLPPFSLDHGAAVPLHFLHRGGWSGPTVLFGLPYRASHAANQAFGRAIARAAAQLGARWGLLASGDMSHRLLPGAPAGYDPRARDFDAWVVEHVGRGDYAGALAVDPALRRLAAEDVIDSLGIALGAAGDATGHRTLSYEGPFGVGYLTAVLKDAEETAP